MTKKMMALLVSATACVIPSRGVLAQTAASAQPTASPRADIDQSIQMLRLDIRSQKKQLIAANLNLTDAEATKFWPVYDKYTADLAQVNDEKYALIKEYADAWGSMSDEQALKLMERALIVDEQVSQLRLRYIPIFTKAVQGKTVATFFQIERRIQAMIDLQLSAQIPLVQARQ